MHPLEGFLFLSYCMVPCLCLHHPIMIVILKLFCFIAASIGHDGYDYPGVGAWFHYCHHKLYNCNYGNENCPLDWLFGNFVDGVDLY